MGPAAYFADAVGQRCEPQPFADGSYRCLPDTVRITRRRYADAACSDSELLFIGDPAGACGNPPATHAVFEQVLDCVGRQLLTVHELGDPYPGAIVHGTWWPTAHACKRL